MQSSPGLSQGIFVNAPDNYFAAGANKDMFYGDPSNSRRARLLDIVLLRQMLYDASFEWLTTQGWSFVPIDNYDGGGPEVQFAPLEVNAADYDLAWAMHMGYGVSGVCWRGTRFFDGPKSKAIVTGWIHFYKKYRQTLTNGGLVHVRRPMAKASTQSCTRTSRAGRAASVAYSSFSTQHSSPSPPRSGSTCTILA